jgi:hypothetical protein
MADDDLIRAYLDTLRRSLRWRPDVDDVIAEVEDHLRLAADRLESTGVARAVAQQRVLLRFGDESVVARSFALTPSGGIAMPTTLTRASGTIAIAAAFLWLLSIPTGLYGQTELFMEWQQASYFVWATIVFGAAVATSIALFGLLRRSGDSWDWSAILVVVLTVLGTLSLGLFTWGWPVGVALLTGAALVTLLRLRAAGLSVGASHWLLVGAWPIGIAVSVLLQSLHLGPYDLYGTHYVAVIIGFGTGGVLFAAGLAAVGLRLRREEPVEDQPSMVAA